MRLYLKVFLSAILALFSFYYIKQAYNKFVYASLGQVQLPITPENTIFVFDIHKVLLEQDLGRILFYELFCGPYSKQFLPLFFKLDFWQTLIKNKQRLRITERISDLFESKYPGLRGFTKRLIEVLNDQPVMPKTIEIVKELKNLGFHLYILSNISDEAYELLSKKHPEIFSLFDGAFMPGKENNYIHKPDLEFYQAFKEYLAKQNNAHKQIIFIDDRLINIKGAEKAGIIGFYFTSADQFKRILIEKKVLTNTRETGLVKSSA